MDISGFRGKTILVTGGAGCVGSNLCRKLSELDVTEVIFPDYIRGRIFSGGGET